LRAVSIDPLNPSILVSLGITYYISRRYNEAIAVCDRAIEVASDASEGHRWKGMSLDELGRSDEALPLLEKAVELSGRHVWAMCNLARVYYRLGRHADALAVEAELTRRSETEAVPPLALALVAAFTDPSLDRGFALLDRAVEARDFWLITLRVEPVVDPYRGDPRLDDVIRRVGIPPLSRAAQS
jgi:tetratricopeptide (TPR) repeat protein